MARHTQVGFITASGEQTEVDAGIYEILISLKVMGVVTQYSCQGDEFGAYVLADRKSFRRVLKAMKKFQRRGDYSLQSGDVVYDLFHTHREIAITWFHKKGKYNESRVIFRRGKRRSSSDYSYEQLLDNQYGFRTTLRWHTRDSEKVLMMFLETQELLGL